MAIEHMPGFADQVEANIKAGKVNPTRVVTDVPTWIRSNLIWYHLFHQPTLARMRQNMFDADPNQEHVERSFEEVMAESSEPLKMLEQIPEHDRYFNHKGEEINGIPDFWALQAGLVWHERRHTSHVHDPQRCTLHCQTVGQRTTCV
jgi:hypothetical protein